MNYSIIYYMYQVLGIRYDVLGITPQHTDSHPLHPTTLLGGHEGTWGARVIGV